MVPSYPRGQAQAALKSVKGQTGKKQAGKKKARKKKVGKILA